MIIKLLPTTAQASLNPIQQVKPLGTSAIKREKSDDKFFVSLRQQSKMELTLSC